MEIRRAHSLVFFWENGKLTGTNYLTGRQVVCSVSLLHILDAVPEFTSLDLLHDQFASVPDSKVVIRHLLSQQVLLRKGSPTERKDALLWKQWKWGHDARFFHFGTREVSYNFNFEEVREFFEKRALTDPPPSPFKTEANKNKIALKKAVYPQTDFWGTLFSRRTCRDFTGKRVPRKLFSAFLTSVFGMTQYYNESVLDKRIIKTSPSGGARHPVEAYVMVKNVEAIPAGIYHYEVETNSLAPIREYIGENAVSKLFSGQYWVKNAAVSFIFTAVLPRSMWKYDHSRAYRVILLDAGHIGQTFHLAGTALGLGVFTTAAVQDKLIEKCLKIDGVSEVVIYAGCIGYARTTAKQKKKHS